MKVIIHHAGQQVSTTMEAYEAVLTDLVQRLGPWAPSQGSRIERIEELATPKRNSSFSGDLVMGDAEAAARVARLKSTWAQATGADVQKTITERQLYKDTTRMADLGYSNETQRDDAFRAMRPARETIAEFADRIEKEHRMDRVMEAGEFARKLTMNGRLKLDGYILRPHAIKGALTRVESKAGGYVQALRDRIVAAAKDDPQREADKHQLLATLVREFESRPDVPLNLRMRAGLGDVFATTSPKYGNADFNVVAHDILDALPDNARAVIEYDEGSTAWTVKASVRTETPALDRVVGEATETGLSIRSADAGNSGFHGGSWALFIACLNAMLLESRGQEVSRTHRTHVTRGLRALVQAAMRGMDAMAQAWAVAKEDVVPTEVRTDAGILLPLDVVVPGFYRHMLSVPRGELVGVLAGRKEQHVTELGKAFAQQRRNQQDVTRADLAQGFTRYAREIEDQVQRTEAQAAIGQWLNRREPVAFQAR